MGKIKEYISINSNEEEMEDQEVMENESFIKRHKKGLIFGGIGAAAALIGALVYKANKDKDDDDFDDDDLEILDLDETDSEEKEEE